jgi:hypothetical protein
MAANAMEVDQGDFEICDSVFSEDGFLVADCETDSGWRIFSLNGEQENLCKLTCR